MPFYEYVCDCGRTVTERRGYDVQSIPCACGGVAGRSPFNTPYIHGTTTPKFQLDPERFLDRAHEIDYAYSKADQEVGAYVPRPKNYRAGLVRAQSMFLEREGLNSKNTKAIVELDNKSLVDIKNQKVQHRRDS